MLESALPVVVGTGEFGQCAMFTSMTLSSTGYPAIAALSQNNIRRQTVSDYLLRLHVLSLMVVKVGIFLLAFQHKVFLVNGPHFSVIASP